MNDYLPKPININELRDKLRQWMPQNEISEESVDYTKKGVNEDEFQSGLKFGKDTDSCPVNERTLKDMFGEDPQAFREILGDFIHPSQRIIGEIRTGWEERCARDIRFAAHKLKSSARSVGADMLADLCLELESAGHEENWDVIDKDVPALGRLISDIEDYINRL